MKPDCPSCQAGSCQHIEYNKLLNEAVENYRPLSWSLGDDYDCDTCGMSWNELGLELWDEEAQIWQLYISVGCYGGQGVLSNEEDWDARSEEIVEYALSYSGFTEKDAKKLRAMLALIKGES